MQFSHLTPDLLDPVVQFITRLNHDDQHHIGYFNMQPEAIARSIHKLNPPPEKGMMVARRDNEVVGVVGVNVDTTLGRMWLHGPMIQHKNWQGIADILYQAVQQAIPLRVNEYEIFCAIENENCQEFARRHNYNLHGAAAIYAFPRERLIDAAPSDVMEISPVYHEQLAELQDRLFPRSYYGGHQITQMLDDHSRVFMTAKGGTLTGYVFCRVEPEFGEAYVDFVGVLETARRQGNARKILTRAFHWAFSYEAIHRVKLTVMARNTAACQLYETVGFDRIKEMVAYRKRYV